MATTNGLNNKSAPFTVTAGDLTVTAGNLLLTVTNVGGTSGLIKFGAVEFVSNFGTSNTFLGGAGNRSLTTANASACTGVGLGALTQLTTGSSNTAVGRNAGNGLTSSANNTCIGASAGFALDTGGASTANVCIGHNSANSLAAGSSNVIIGDGAYANSVGSSNVILGGSAGGNYTTGTCSNNICIASAGPTVAGNESATIRIGTSGTHTKAFMSGIRGITTGTADAISVVIDSTGQLGTSGASTTSKWTVITANQTAAIGNGYFDNKAGTLALLLPATSAVGDVIEVTNENTATGTQITQAAGQQILLGNTNTTLGAGGSLTSTQVGDTLKLVCKVANTIFRVTSVIGNWTVV